MIDIYIYTILERSRTVYFICHIYVGNYIENKYGMVTNVCMYGDQCMAMYGIIPYIVNQKIEKKV